MTECSECGVCCDPVTLAYTQAEARGNYRLHPDERRWVLEDLTPMSRREAKEKRPDLFKGRATVDQYGKFAVTFYYRCKWFDDDTRRCTNYENRPQTCSGYPWYGERPDRRATLPSACSFRADIGLPVEVPVTLSRKS